MPAVALARETAVLDRFDSLARAAQAMRDFGCDTAIVTEMGKAVGWIDEKCLLKAQVEGETWTSPIESHFEREFFSIHASETGASALRQFEFSGARCLVVLDSAGSAVGLLYPSDLIPRPLVEARPPMVGGMATPFGVYLTNGKIRAGAKDMSLLATGALLFLMFICAMFASDTMASFWVQSFGKSDLVASLQQDAFPTFLFLLAMRLLPLSGIHAAEHKVVHAIERGEPLIAEIVDRMPRVHPRCGTNLAAAAGLFLGLMNSTWIADSQLRLLVAALATLMFWRPLGSLLQLWVTTRPPNAKQLEMGISAGRELVQKYQSDRERTASPLIRIWSSGMLHVMAGSMLMYGLIELVAWVFQINIVL
jgi:hypothetical protein